MKRLLFILLLICIQVNLDAQDITVYSSGSGSSKEEATKIALRNALEDAYGTFISSSTKIMNDVLVSDEIVSISQGNIKKYEIINAIQGADGQYKVNVKSTISLNKLANFCEGKGMSVSFNGSALNMNLKMMEFNKENEYKAIKNVIIQILEIQRPIYDFEISVKDPQVSGENVNIIANISLKKNDNYKNTIGAFIKTMTEVSIKKNERKLYDKLGMPYVEVSFNRFSALPLLSKDFYYFRNEKTLTLIQLMLQDNIPNRNLAKLDNRISYEELMEKTFQIQIDDNETIDALGSYCISEGISIFRTSYKLEYSTSSNELSHISEIKISPFCNESYERIKKHIQTGIRYVDKE